MKKERLLCKKKQQSVNILGKSTIFAPNENTKIIL